VQKPRLRKPRFIRSDGIPPLHLTERDVGILRLVERHRFVHSGHLCSALAGSVQHITRRLGRLFHAGFLDRPKAQLLIQPRANAHMVCCITNAGQAILRERGFPTFASPPRARGETVALSLSHTLRVTDVMLAFERTAAACGARFLHREDWQKDSEEGQHLTLMRWSITIQYDAKRVRCAVIPDAVFALDQEGKRSYFFVEADRGTMPVSRGSADQTSFRRKVLAYKATRDAGILWKRHAIPGFRVLVIAESERRLRSLRSAAAACFQRGDSTMLCFTLASNFLSGQEAWQTCGERSAFQLFTHPRS